MVESPARLPEPGPRQVPAPAMPHGTLFRSAFDEAPIGMALNTPTGCFQVVNQAFCELFGYAEEELIGRSFLDLTHPEDREASRRAVGRAMHGDGGRIRMQKRYLRRDGSVVWGRVTATLVRDDVEQPLHWIAQIEDVTAHRAAVRALERNKDRLEEAQRIAHVGHWEWHLDMGACAWSAELCHLLGGPPTSVRPGIDTFLERVHPEDRPRVKELLDRALAEGARYALEHRLLLPDGTVRWVQGEAHVERDSTGVPVRMIGTVQDITPRKAAEERLQVSEQQLREAQRFESVRRMAGGIAHDFNNLLLVITGHAGLLSARLPPDDPAHGEVRAIAGAADRAAALTRQLLAFSRRQVLQPRVLDLNAIVREVEKALQRMIGEDVALVTALEANLGTVRADPGQLEQVLLNLAVNARDAMPDGGRLTIATHNEDIAPADLHAGLDLDPGAYVVLTVMDTGCGMDAATLENIFEPFFTTKPRGKGTGLGLSTVHGIVKQSGGEIRVRTRVGEGSCFTIHLPRCDAPLEKVASAPPSTEAVRGTETLLVVEDDEVIHQLTMRILEGHGYKVLGALGGDEALHVLEMYRAPIHMLVTDVVMPGMSGPELVRRAREVRPELKVLYVTGYADRPELVEESVDTAGALLQKPFTPVELSRKVRAHLD